MKKVSVNADVCIGCGLCTTICGDVFQIGDAGVAEALMAETDLAEVDEAAASCPVQAIEVE